MSDRQPILERLKAKRAVSKGRHREQIYWLCSDSIDEIHRLREENERFRTALRKIDNYETETDWQTYSGEPPAEIEHCGVIARQALSQEKEPS